MHDQQGARTVAPADTRRPFVSVRWIVQIRLNRGLRAAQATGDLRDWQTLLIAILARERSCPTTLLNTINARHPRVRYRPSPIFPVDESRPLGQDYVAGRHRIRSTGPIRRTRGTKVDRRRSASPSSLVGRAAGRVRYSCRIVRNAERFTESPTHATRMAVTHGSRQPVEIVPKPLSRVGFARHPWLPQRRNGGAGEPPRTAARCSSRLSHKQIGLGFAHNASNW